MKAIARAAGLASALLGVVVLTSACNTSPGAAAVIGGDRISTATLQDEVNSALRNPQANAQLGHDRLGFTRTELGRLINNVIVADAAAAHHITVTAADVDRQFNDFAQQAGGTTQLASQAAQSGIPGSELRSFTRYFALQQKLADALVANVPVTAQQLRAAYQKNISNYDQVHSAHILVKSKSLADSILAQVQADPSKFASLAAKYSTDTSNKGNGGDLGFAGSGQFVPVFSEAIFAAKPGSFIEVHSQFGWHVVHVIAHRHISLAQATPDLKTTILKSTRDQMLAKALSDEAKKVGVHVNPRYGRWDPAQGTVVALSTKDSVSSPSPAPSG